MSAPTRPAVAIIGLGLIGGSLALALRRRGFRVSGIDRDPRTLTLARRRGAVRTATASIRNGVRDADLVILCVPVQAVARCLREVAAGAPPGAVVTDAASVKGPVLALVRGALPCPARFVGGHPMAGGERGGFVHARADLFRGRVCVLTPVAGTSARAVREVTGLWRAAGARVVSMSPRRHDAAAARASHLPHLVAYALVDILRDRDARTLASGSFLDATRVAASDPGLWTSILRANRTQVVRAARDQARRMAGLLREIAAGSPAGLRRALRLASGLRRRAGAAA